MRAYRNLEEGEVIKKGDEIPMSEVWSIGWREVCWKEIGKPCNPDQVVRRAFSEIKLSREALDILEGEDVPRKHTEVIPHAFPIKVQTRMWEPRSDWSFSHEQVQYNGAYAIYALTKTRKAI